MTCAMPAGVLPTELSSVLGAGHVVIYLIIVNQSKCIYERANFNAEKFECIQD